MRQEIAGLVIVFRNTLELHEKTRAALNEIETECERTGKLFKNLKQKRKTLRYFLGTQPEVQLPDEKNLARGNS